MADYINEVQKLYVAYFSRPADPAGLTFWANQLATNPQGYQNISAEFSTSAEYKATYGGMSNAQVVGTVYTHLFGRPAEQAGVDWWAAQMSAGNVTIDKVVTQIAAGAQGSDLFAYNAKVAVSTAFTQRVDLPEEMKAYSGAKANQIAVDFIATVKDLESAASARDPGKIDAVISAIVQAGASGMDDVHLVGVSEAPPSFF